jgi:DUF1680 family protein
MITGETKYAEWAERMMYNTLLSGVDAKGENWFYCNPISCDGTPGDMRISEDGKIDSVGRLTGIRWENSDCYCCPPSVARTIAMIHNWFYNTSDDGSLWINFYGGNKLETSLPDGSVFRLTQVTNYPWDGKVEIKIEEDCKKSVAVNFRIPGWTENPVVFINGERMDTELKPGTYSVINRKWKNGDVISLDFPMPVHFVKANPKVGNLIDKAAIMRGPVVYCMEFPLRENGKQIVQKGVFLHENMSFTTEYRKDFLNGFSVIKGKALTNAGKDSYFKNLSFKPVNRVGTKWDENELYRNLKATQKEFNNSESVEIELIPYYGFANRGLALMNVWIPSTF